MDKQRRLVVGGKVDGFLGYFCVEKYGFFVGQVFKPFFFPVGNGDQFIFYQANVCGEQIYPFLEGDLAIFRVEKDGTVGGIIGQVFKVVPCFGSDVFPLGQCGVGRSKGRGASNFGKKCR
jgi:hypothetical protein